MLSYRLWKSVKSVNGWVLGGADLGSRYWPKGFSSDSDVRNQYRCIVLAITIINHKTPSSLAPYRVDHSKLIVMLRKESG